MSMDRGAWGRLIAARDPLFAAALLTRLPVPIDHAAAGARGAGAAWAYPVVGAGLGLVCGALYAGLSSLGVATIAAAWAAVGLGVLLTGALHEDGLADAADGMLLHRGRARALEIMRDSQIGAFGAVALVVVLSARAGAIASFAAVEGIAALVAAGALSRAAMVGVWAWSPSARADGLAARAGRPSPGTAVLGAAAAVGASLFAVGFGLAGWALAVACAGLAAWAVGRLARARLGGQTGDVLGAAQQLAEAGALIALTI